MKHILSLKTSYPLWARLTISLLIIAFFFTFFFAQSTWAKEIKTPASLLSAVEQRNTEIDTREQNVVEREARLNLLEEEIRSMLDEYIKLKEVVDLRESEHTLALKKEKEKRIKRLAKIYQSMDAKQAANRIRQMKKKTALSVLRQIKEKQAAKILSNMSAAQATQFSEAFIKTEK